MKEIFRFFHKCFFALQKFKSFFILSIFFDALLQGIKLIEPWILASMLDSLYKNSKDVFLQKVATLSLIIIMQITLSYIFIRLKSYVTRGVNAVCILQYHSIRQLLPFSDQLHPIMPWIRTEAHHWLPCGLRLFVPAQINAQFSIRWIKKEQKKFGRYVIRKIKFVLIWLQLKASPASHKGYYLHLVFP